MRNRRQLLLGVLLRGLASFLLANFLLLHVPVSAVSLGVVAVAAVLALFLRPSQSLPLAGSLAASIVVLEVLVRSGLAGVSPYYRPHERLALETSYRPRQRVEMTVPHGDLLTIDPALPRELATPRQEVFVTDGFGYRNDEDFDGERLVLIGDSFLVGTQTTLAQYLRDQRDTHAYNVSFASTGPLIYADKVRWARSRLGDKTCIAMYFFEGNDFQFVDPDELARRRAVPRGIQIAIKNYVLAVRRPSEWSKTFFGLSTRAAESIRWGRGGRAPLPRRDVTFVRTVNGHPIVFLKGYADVVRRSSFDDHGFIRDQLASAPPDIAFFIPDKFRVYSSLLDDQAEPDLPHAQWEYLRVAATALGIPAIDLTPALVERSRALALSGEWTFWPDDTHWNLQGEAVAGDMLLTSLAKSTSQRCAGVLAESN